jgi:hypothetical protein
MRNVKMANLFQCKFSEGCLNVLIRYKESITYVHLYVAVCI